MNQIDSNARQYVYSEFPQHYVWNKTTKKWTKRYQGDVIGRVYTIDPSNRECYYLRILLNNVKGPTSFIDLRTVNNHIYATFKESALKRKLIEPEKMYHKTMQEAIQYKMPSALRQLFVTILLFGEPNNVRSLWDNNFNAMSEDFVRKGIPDNYLRVNAVLLQISNLLEQHHKSLNEYDLPLLISPDDNSLNELSRLILNELNIPITNDDLEKIELLNESQKVIFDTVINRIEKNQQAIIFVDGPAGENMRIEDNPENNNFKNFLLRIGNGTEPTVNNDMIKIPENMAIRWHNDESLQTLIEEIYPSISFYSSNTSYFTDAC
ncbi:5100_t:CDS:2, partial [Cetraspora pellucida]